MDVKFICTNSSCPYPGSSRFEISFKPETILDYNNIADPFCPFCKKVLTLATSPDAHPPSHHGTQRNQDCR